MTMKKLTLLVLFLLCLACGSNEKKKDHQLIDVKKTTLAPTIDGKATENCWSASQWHALDQNWTGEAYSHTDFNGRYKLAWDVDALYLLVEITDNMLFDQKEDPFKLWWNDDSLQIYIDEDNSGGLHQYSYNAFGYSISLDGKVVDVTPDRKPQFFNEHLISKRSLDNSTTTWEIALKLFNDNYSKVKSSSAEKLFKGKKIGFALAYSDNDESRERENLIGSVFISGEDKNIAWIDADIFGTLVLIE